MPVPSRKWGDGGNDKRVHVIEAISYTDDYIECRCGVRLKGVTDGSVWVDHGGRGVKGDYTEAREPAVAEEARMGSVLATFVDTAARCTCDTTSVLDCPNYLSGDEEVDADGD